MASARENQLTRQAGEYLVAAELARREFICTTFTGNIPGFDILAIHKGSQAIPIQVKTSTKGNWRFDAKSFLKISISGNTQKVLGKTKLDTSDLICVFVRLKGNSSNEDEFYICKMKDIQKIIFDIYKRSLSEKKGVRPRKPTSTYCAVSPKDLEGYKNNWQIIQ